MKHPHPLDTSLLALCLATPRSTAELVDALGAKGDLGLLATIYQRLARLWNRRKIERQTWVVSGRVVTLWATRGEVCTRLGVAGPVRCVREGRGPQSAREIAATIGAPPHPSHERAWQLGAEGLLSPRAHRFAVKQRRKQPPPFLPQPLPFLRRGSGVRASTRDAVLQALDATLDATLAPTSQVAKRAGLHDDTALAALVGLAKRGEIRHAKAPTKTAPHLWALATGLP